MVYIVNFFINLQVQTIYLDYYTSRDWLYCFFSSRLELYEYTYPEIHAWKDCPCIKEVRQGILDARPLCLYAFDLLHLDT